MTTTHPAAAVWPMLDEPDLRRLAEDIRSNGLRHPIVLDTDGRVLDGRNRLAACRIAGVEPTFETYEGDDPVGYVLSANNQRRHLTLPRRAAATALTLAGDGRRGNGRWNRDSVPDMPDVSGQSSSSEGWIAAMSRAGAVLKATSRANRLLRKIHRTGQLVLGWWGVADDPVAVITRTVESGQRPRRKDERVALRAMTPRDFRDFATEERRRAADDFGARNDTCSGAERVADWMTQAGYGHFLAWAQHELPIPDVEPTAEPAGGGR
jgi:hypothetical protein